MIFQISLGKVEWIQTYLGFIVVILTYIPYILK